MNIMKAFGILIAGLVLFGCIIGGCALTRYNRAVALDEGVKGAWGQVDNQLQRRFDLIPNLVETVKGYAGHEKELFENIANARTKYFSAGSQNEKVKAASGFGAALSRLLVLKETYPDLKANQSFLQLSAQIEGTENRLSVERKRYNDAVRALNTYARTFIGRMFCSWAGVEQADYFESTEAAKDAPKVSFDKET